MENASVRKTRRVELQTWVPAEVRSYVRQMEKQSLPPMKASDEKVRHLEIVQRLATAPRMRWVWKELKPRAKRDQALLMFFCVACAVPELRKISDLHTRDEIDLSVSIWSGAAALSRLEKESMAAKSSPELMAALELAAQRFETVAKEWDRTNVVKQLVKDDPDRHYVHVLGSVNKTFFGSILLGSVATVATVALRRTITQTQVRQWCKPEVRSSAILNRRK